jgi:hypothetical protein
MHKMPGGPQHMGAKDAAVGDRLLRIRCSGGSYSGGSQSGGGLMEGTLRRAPPGVGKFLGLDGQEAPDDVVGRLHLRAPQQRGTEPATHHLVLFHGRLRFPPGSL